MAEISIITLLNGKMQIIKKDLDNISGGDRNVDGGVADTIYLPDQCVDGGDANG